MRKPSQNNRELHHPSNIQTDIEKATFKSISKNAITSYTDAVTFRSEPTFIIKDASRVIARHMKPIPTPSS